MSLRVITTKKSKKNNIRLELNSFQFFNLLQEGFEPRCKSVVLTGQHCLARAPVAAVGACLPLGTGASARALGSATGRNGGSFSHHTLSLRPFKEH